MKLLYFLNWNSVKFENLRPLFEYGKLKVSATKQSQFWINLILIRHEPDSLGEKNYKYVLDLLQSYDKEWIGLEYIPKSDTNGGLKWIENFGFHLWFFKRLDLSTCNFQLENTNLLQLNWSQILCYRYV